MTTMNRAPLSRTKFLPLAFAATLLASAQAQTTPPAAGGSAPAGRPEDEVLLPAFTVEADAESGYIATNSVSATKIATELKNLPVSIDVVTEQFLKDYGLVELPDILGATAGVTSSQRQSGTLDSYTVRGFITYFSGRNGNTNFRSYDSANVARVEVVSGPMSVLYGQVDPGGVANTVTKQPSPRAQTNVRIEAGSWDYFRTELGTTGPLNAAKTLTYRLDCSFLDRDGFRDFDTARKTFYAPTLKWTPRKGTSLTLDGEYNRYRQTGLGNWPRYFNRPANEIRFADMIPRTFNAEGPGLGLDLTGKVYTATLEHALNDRIVIRNQAGVSSRASSISEANATAINTTSAAVLPFARTMSLTEQPSRVFSNQLNLAARFDFGKRHYTRVVAGWEYNESKGDNRNWNSGAGTGAPTPANWDLAKPATWDRTVPDLRLGRLASDSRSEFWEDKYYLVDALALFNERIMTLAGVNYSNVENLSKNRLNQTALRIERDRWTPQAGLVVRVLPAVGLYANYAESFRQITTLRINQDRSLTPFDPLIAKGLDYGLKFDFGGGRYSGQVTGFRILYLNARQSFTATDAIGTYTYELQNGETTSEGAEVRLAANVTKNFQLMGGYTYTDARVTQNPANRTIEGRWLPRAPKHRATLTASYRFSQARLKGVSVGASANYNSIAKAFETTDPFLINDRTVISARAGYTGRLFGREVVYNVLVNNLTNKFYYPSSIGPGDPRSYRFSAEYKF